ncbi:MAG: hypothetical protein JO093_07740 [Acidobacteria bacterium]|nr:hypothetical protein [Acidobacteriota bacterium]MBV9185497.1 hypothetical protein [Acidobacteriota bacterium]
MPYEIVLNQKPMGYAKGSAREGEMTIVVAREFLSSEVVSASLPEWMDGPAQSLMLCHLKLGSVLRT